MSSDRRKELAKIKTEAEAIDKCGTLSMFWDFHRDDAKALDIIYRVISGKPKNSKRNGLDDYWKTLKDDAYPRMTRMKRRLERTRV